MRPLIAWATAAGVGSMALALPFGALVGLSLGLTGGGGSIFAVPLLVFGMGVAPREAIGVSLIAVGATAMTGGLRRLGRGEVELGTGLLFAASGMLGAPVGSWLGGFVSDGLLLTLFATLMTLVAARMWFKAAARPDEAGEIRASFRPRGEGGEPTGPACRRDPEGRLQFTSRCLVVLAAAGAITGVLAGLFGVGGGFVIVPALVLAGGLDIQRAVATSLPVIALVSASGAVARLASEPSPRLDLIVLFVLGGVIGMELGAWLGRRLGGPRLQKFFAASMVGVAAFIVIETLA